MNFYMVKLKSYEFNKYKTKSKKRTVNLFLKKYLKNNIDKKNSKYHFIRWNKFNKRLSIRTRKYSSSR